jgi:hypothetical protein
MPEIPVPPRLADMPRDRRGYIIPWFVPIIDGEPIFPAMKPDAPVEALMKRLCWVCGAPREGIDDTFVIGPMCAINRTSSEPPSHMECAMYSALACPFLTKPRQRRANIDAIIPEDVRISNEYAIERNPGVALVWTSAFWQPFRAPNGQLLFHIGEPLVVMWFAEARSATREEVMASIDSGYPILRAMAEQEGLEAILELAKMRHAAEQYVPVA